MKRWVSREKEGRGEREERRERERNKEMEGKITP